MEFEISLENLSFFGYHGVMEEEKRLGNEFKVWISIWLPIFDNWGEDSIDSTISYAELYEIVNKEMEIPRNLLETVAFRIGKEIRRRFPNISKGKVKIEKVRPPIPGMLGSASVSLLF